MAAMMRTIGFAARKVNAPPTEAMPAIIAGRKPKKRRIGPAMLAKAVAARKMAAPTFNTVGFSLPSESAIWANHLTIGWITGKSAAPRVSLSSPMDTPN